MAVFFVFVAALTGGLLMWRGAAAVKAVGTAIGRSRFGAVAAIGGFVLFVITVIAANAWQGARDFSDAPVHGALLGAAAAVAALFVCGLISWICTRLMIRHNGERH